MSGGGSGTAACPCTYLYVRAGSRGFEGALGIVGVCGELL